MTDTQARIAVPDTRDEDVPRLRIASVPAGHVYVRHLSSESTPGPERLPDPDPLRPTAPAGAVWWPPVMLQPSWAATADFDVFHLHFGFDACDPEELRDLVDTLRRRGKPFVFTVHDLRNPHHLSREAHDAQLDVLIPAADALVTLTAGAASEIRRRWGREAVVIPHPHVVELEDMATLQRDRPSPGAAFRVGLHVKSLRPSMAPLRILPTLVRAVTELPGAVLPGAVLQVNAHRDVMDDDGARRDDQLADYLRGAAAEGLIDLRVHDFLPDDELWTYLASLDVSVLPYRFGTHSGWLEACRDLGTTVVAPTCGFYRDQGPVLSYTHDEDHFDPNSLVAAIATAYWDRPAFGAGLDERRVQRQAIAAAHDHLYRSLSR
ncbi:glycosyltransferase family 1 protein [Nocardioides conyzicola]|uniref:Glycosyltransferase family 1 protein n=1 Tax=Nocardioides conyzicola TaxID=1651781 RepID=A0ABP8XZA5_9ACTN